MNSTHSRILKNFLLIFFIALIQESPAQYRDSFSSKKKYQKISKKNKKGLFSSNRSISVKKEKDPFRNINSSKGLVGLDKDPFSSSIKNKYKPTGVSSDSFNYRQRKRAIREKYNSEYVKNKSYKSRVKHYRLKMKYG